MKKGKPVPHNAWPNWHCFSQRRIKPTVSNDKPANVSNSKPSQEVVFAIDSTKADCRTNSPDQRCMATLDQRRQIIGWIRLQSCDRGADSASCILFTCKSCTAPGLAGAGSNCD